MSRVTVTIGIDRAARLIPFDAGNLRGDYAAVCSPVQTVPAELQDAQRERTAFYMSHTWEEGNRTNPPHAPRYFVTSYGRLIAWVTLDGRTHKVPDWDLTDYGNGDPTEPHVWRTMRRHRDAITALWPEQFEMDSMGDPVRPRS